MNKKENHKISILLERNSNLIIVIVCIVLLLIIKFVSPYSLLVSKSSSLLIGMVTGLLSAAVLNLMWEIRSKAVFYEEMEKNFFDRIDSIISDVNVLKLVNDDGLVYIATDFHKGIEWKRYIEGAKEIDICWWSGRSWIKGNKIALNEFIKNGGAIRIIMPDIENPYVMEQMCRDSGFLEEQLYLAQKEAISLLAEFDRSNISVEFMSRVPRYMYIRIGNHVCVAAYSLNQGAFTESVTLVLDADKNIAKRYIDDYEKLIKTEQMKEVRLNG